MIRNKIRGVSIFLTIVLTFFLIINIAITVKAANSNEAIASDNLNMQINESGTYEWNVRNPGNITSLKATGSVSSNGTAKVYVEKDGKRYLVFDSTKPLFDVNINVLPEYKKIFQGDEILIQITLFNLRGFGAGNVDVKYLIKDSKGNVIAAEAESIFVETQAKFIRKLVVPADIKTGTYAAFVEGSSKDALVGTGSDTFEVKSKYESKPQLKYYVIGISAVVLIIILISLGIYLFKKIRKKQKIVELIRMVIPNRIGKLEKELESLEVAYKSKFISEESYKKEKKRVEDLLKALKK